MKPSLKKILIMSALTLALSAVGQVMPMLPSLVVPFSLPRSEADARNITWSDWISPSPDGQVFQLLPSPGGIQPGSSIFDSPRQPDMVEVDGSRTDHELVNIEDGSRMGSGLNGDSPMTPNFQPGNIVFGSPGQQPYLMEVDGSGTDHELANMGVGSRMGSGLNGNSPMAPNLQPDSFVIGSPGQPGWVVMGSSETDSVGPMTDTSVAPVMLNGATFQVQLSLALQRGQPLQGFIVFALQNGVTVADITRELLKSGLVPAPVALTALGQVFSGNESLLTVVFSVAITVPEITLDPAAVETAIEAGCGKDCLPASLIAGVTNTNIRVEQQLSLELQSLPLSTLTNSTSSGSGSGTARPVSPAG